jgi:hypothetical protein
MTPNSPMEEARSRFAIPSRRQQEVHPLHRSYRQFVVSAVTFGFI